MNTVLSIILWLTYLLSLYFSIFWFIVFLDQRTNFKNQDKKKAKLKKCPFVSVLIPAFNEEEVIKETIKSVLDLDYPKDKLEIIVINDGSTDNTKQEVEGLIDKYKDRNIILINQENQGKAASLNNALKIARGEFFSCLDADSFVDKDTLKKMLALYESNDSDLTIVTPALKVAKPYSLIQKFQRLEYIVAMFVARLMSYLDCIYVAPGPFSLYRTEIIRKLGGFDAGNLTEDQEIAYRVQKHHYKIKQCHDAYVHTIAPRNIQELYRQRNRWYKGSLINIVKYRKLMWNRRYGDFGIMQMSINLLVFLLCSTALFFLAYFLVWPFFKNIYNLYLIGFDIIPYLRDIMDFDLSILSMNIPIIMIISFLFIISIMIFYLAHRNANERIRKYGILYLIPYYLVYYLILSFMAVVIIVQVAIGKKQKW